MTTRISDTKTELWVKWELSRSNVKPRKFSEVCYGEFDKKHNLEFLSDLLSCNLATHVVHCFQEQDTCFQTCTHLHDVLDPLRELLSLKCGWGSIVSWYEGAHRGLSGTCFSFCFCFRGRGHSLGQDVEPPSACCNQGLWDRGNLHTPIIFN